MSNWDTLRTSRFKFIGTYTVSSMKVNGHYMVAQLQNDEYHLFMEVYLLKVKNKQISPLKSRKAKSH